MTTMTSGTILLTFLVSSTALASDLPYITTRSSLNDWRARPVGAAAARVDTVDMLGGPARNDGRFEDAQGQPDWHGWTHEDATAGESHWHVSEFMAVSGQFSLWCGRYFGADPGYGNGWDESLVFTHRVADPALPSAVRWRASLRNDTEAGYDFTDLSVNRGGVWTALATVSGDTLLFLDESLTWAPADYAGPAGDEIQLRVRVVSDLGWSDGDGILDTDGACQLDDLLVEVDGQVVCVEDFEDGVSDHWQPRDAPVGDFAALYSGLLDLDVCRSNRTVQVAFIDDGVVVPGTGGATVHHLVLRPRRLHRQSLRRPVRSGGASDQSPRQSGDVLAGGHGRHDPRLHLVRARGAWTGSPGSPGFLVYARVRSTADPVADPIEDRPMADLEQLRTCTAGPATDREHMDLSSLPRARPRGGAGGAGSGRTRIPVRRRRRRRNPGALLRQRPLFAYPYAGPAVRRQRPCGRPGQLPRDRRPRLHRPREQQHPLRSMHEHRRRSADRNDPGDSIVIDVLPVRAGSCSTARPPVGRARRPIRCSTACARCRRDSRGRARSSPAR